jgi:hypothetical protein
VNSRHRGTEAQRQRSTEAKKHRGTEAKKHRGTEAKTLRTSFSATVELLLIGSPRSYIIFDFQQLLLLTNFDQTHGYGDRIEAMFLVYFYSYF